MKKLILFFVIGLCSLHINSQCKLLTSAGTFESICFQKIGIFSKLGRSTYMSEYGEISIAAKKDSSGLFIIKLEKKSDYKFKNNVIIYLDDNTIITLINRNISWKVNGALFGQYNLTKGEIKKLKASNISAVRFWCCRDSYGSDCDDATEYYNKDHTTALGTEVIKRVDFPKLIAKLFD